MHFGFALDLSDIDLLNKDLLDQRYTYTHLYFVFPRRLEDVFKTCICLQNMKVWIAEGLNSCKEKRSVIKIA